MSDTTPVDVEPYDLDWLAPDGRIREIITRYNNPDSPQRKMLATLDLVWDRSRELEAIVRDLAASNPQSLQDQANWTSWKVWIRAVEFVSAHPVSGDQPDA